MKLIDDWRTELNKLWSVRAAIAGALLAVADQILAVFVGKLPPLVYALIFVLIIVFRVLYQKPNAANP